MATLTRRGARTITKEMDRAAGLVQHRHTDLGIPEEYALRYAKFTDFIANTIELHAAKMAEAAPEEKEEEKVEEKPEEKKASVKVASSKKASAKKADDETGLSVDHGTSGFDANVIADDVGGPQEILAPIESWMSGFFSQDWFHELGDLVQSNEMSNAAARGKIITKAAQSLAAHLGKKAEEEKAKDEEEDAAKKEAAEDERLLQAMLAEESVKLAAKKKAEEAKPEEKKAEPPKKEEEKEASAKQAEESEKDEDEDEDEDEGTDKSASTFGFGDIFSN